MTDSTRRSRWIGWVAPLLLLALVAAVVWAVGSAAPEAKSTQPAASPSVAVQYRMAQVKTATPLPTATAAVGAGAPPDTRPVAATRAPAPTLVPTLPAPTTSPAQASLDEVKRMAPDAALEQVEQGTAVFVDVRSAATYEQGHLPGAISLPGGVSTTGYRELPGDKLLIFYCS